MASFRQKPIPREPRPYRLRSTPTTQSVVNLTEPTHPTERKILAVDFGTTYTSVGYYSGKIDEDNYLLPGIASKEIVMVKDFLDAPPEGSQDTRSEVPTQVILAPREVTGSELNLDAHVWGYSVSQYTGKPQGHIKDMFAPKQRSSSSVSPKEPSEAERAATTFLSLLFRHSKTYLTRYDIDLSHVDEIVFTVPLVWDWSSRHRFLECASQSLVASGLLEADSKVLESLFVLGEPEAGACWYFLSQETHRKSHAAVSTSILLWHLPCSHA